AVDDALSVCVIPVERHCPSEVRGNATAECAQFLLLGGEAVGVLRRHLKLDRTADLASSNVPEAGPAEPVVDVSLVAGAPLADVHTAHGPAQERWPDLLGVSGGRVGCTPGRVVVQHGYALATVGLSKHGEDVGTSHEQWS